MDDCVSVFLIGGEPDEQATFELQEIGDNCRVICTYRGKVIASEASDFFDALCDIRLQLSPEHLIPFCYGASLNVYPSPMARDMGGALKAYRLQMGKPAKTVDLVNIFTAGPDLIPASVDLQKQYYADWISSLES